METLLTLERNENDLNLIEVFVKIANYIDKGEFMENDKILDFVKQIYNERKISRDVLYLTLLSQFNISITQEITKYEQHLFRLLEYPGSLYDFVICKYAQWFELCIKEDSPSVNIFDQKILSTVEVLKLIDHSNKYLNCVQNELQDNDVEFWKIYFSRLTFLWQVTEYCQLFASCKNTNEMFLYSSRNPCLKILFNYLNRDEFQSKKVLDFIKTEDQLYNPMEMKQINNFLAYDMCVTIFQTIEDIKSLLNIKNVMYNLREKLLSINNKQMIINVLQTIFSILFILTTDYRNNDKVNTFFCQESEVRLILFLLKELFDEIKSKSLFIVNTKEYFDFLNIQKHVTNALWRMELINTVKSPEKCQRKLLKYMLALPQSLIQMCLKEGDYERAYQVVQVRNLISYQFYFVF